MGDVAYTTLLQLSQPTLLQEAKQKKKTVFFNTPCYQASYLHEVARQWQMYTVPAVRSTRSQW